MTSVRACLLSATVLAGVALLAPSAARASGFALREGDADWMANGFAGVTAKAYDASTAFANPAGMVRINENEITQAINYIAPSSKFSGSNTTPFGPVLGNSNPDVAEDAVVPSGYGVWSYSPKLKFGFSAESPFGQRIKNPGDFVGRYQSLTSSISDLNFGISAAYAITDKISIGGGPSIDYFEARLTQAINLNTGALGLVTGSPVGDLHGHDTAVGWNVGALYQVNPNLRFGVDYHSSIVHAITGTQGVTVPGAIAAFSPQTAALLLSQTSLAKTKVTLPDSATFGAYWQINPQWAVMADAGWTHWSLVDKIVVTPQQPFVVGSSTPVNFRDTGSAAIGASYRPISKLLLQTGFLYDESPVDGGNRGTRIPDSDRYLIGIGATYSILPSVDVTLAYAHVFFASAPINSQAPNPGFPAGVISGKYDTSADTFSVGATVKF